MRRFFMLVLLTLAATCGAFAQGATTKGNWLAGDYIEARTASVFAGACHYNGEVVTTGRDAVLAWNIRAGQWNGTNMAGVRAIAVVSAATNLSEIERGQPKYELIVDDAATAAQFQAFADIVRARFASLGASVALRRAPVKFRQGDKAFAFESAGFAKVSIRAMPDNLCCKMPNMVWYSPLVKLSNRKVGYTLDASYAGGALGDAWQRGGENSAFYGSFAL